MDATFSSAPSKQREKHPLDLDTFRSGRVYFARIYYKIGGESAYVLRVILWVDWDGMIDLSIR